MSVGLYWVIVGVGKIWRYTTFGGKTYLCTYICMCVHNILPINRMLVHFYFLPPLFHKNCMLHVHNNMYCTIQIKHQFIFNSCSKNKKIYVTNFIRFSYIPTYLHTYLLMSGSTANSVGSWLVRGFMAGTPPPSLTVYCIVVLTWSWSSISNDTPVLCIWVNSENSNGLAVIRHRSSIRFIPPGYRSCNLQDRQVCHVEDF